jgi:hypothetical protein
MSSLVPRWEERNRGFAVDIVKGAAHGPLRGVAFDRVLVHQGRDDFGVDFCAWLDVGVLSPELGPIGDDAIVHDDNIIAPHRLVVGINSLKPVGDKPCMADNAQRALVVRSREKSIGAAADSGLVIRGLQHRLGGNGILVHHDLVGIGDRDAGGFLGRVIAKE